MSKSTTDVLKAQTWHACLLQTCAQTRKPESITFMILLSKAQHAIALRLLCCNHRSPAKVMLPVGKTMFRSCQSSGAPSQHTSLYCMHRSHISESIAIYPGGVTGKPGSWLESKMPVLDRQAVELGNMTRLFDPNKRRALFAEPSRK